MDHQEQKIIKTEDIPSHEHELPEMMCGIGKPKQSDDEYTYINSSTEQSELKLTEGYDFVGMSDHVDAAITGDDYHTDLHRLHSSVPQYMPLGEKTNAYDSYIHDILKRGKPNGSTIAHILDVIHGPVSDSYNNAYLDKKWTPFITKHASNKPEFNTLESSHLTHDEVMNLPSGFAPYQYRMMRHSLSSNVFELHPTDGLRYIGTKSNAAKYAQTQGASHPSATVAQNHLTSAYESFPSEPVHNYTQYSASLNRYLHHVHNGREYDDYDSIMSTSVSSIKKHSTELSKYFKETPSPTHTGDFHVYTGVYAEVNPTMSDRRDENGKILYHSPSFTSTSLDRGIALEFAKTKQDSTVGGRDVADVLKLKIPGGYASGAYVEPNTAHSGESEYLLDKGHTFKIHKDPKYYFHEHKLIREWDAEIHHKADYSSNFSDLSTQSKINRVLAPYAPEKDIEAGAIDSNIAVRAAAAKHPKLSPESIHRMSNDESLKVKHALYRNPSTPDSILDAALKEKSVAAASIAERPFLHDHQIMGMIHSGVSDLSAAVATRHDLEDHHVQSLIDLNDPKTTVAIASNQHVHPDMLHELARHADTNVRVNLAINPSIHWKTANTLIADTSPLVRTNARMNKAMFRPH